MGDTAEASVKQAGSGGGGDGGGLFAVVVSPTKELNL